MKNLNQTSLKERFLKYRNDVKVGTVKKKVGRPGRPVSKTVDKNVPEISYPTDYDVKDELTNLVGYVR